MVYIVEQVMLQDAKKDRFEMSSFDSNNEYVTKRYIYLQRSSIYLLMEKDRAVRFLNYLQNWSLPEDLIVTVGGRRGM